MKIEVLADADAVVRRAAAIIAAEARAAAAARGRFIMAFSGGHTPWLMLRALAGNIFGVLNGRPPQSFVYSTLGMMGSLGHSRAFGQLLKVRVRGVLAWFVRRTYYLLQMPGWGRRLHIMIDWSFALLFRPDIVKLSLDSEKALLEADTAAGGVVADDNHRFLRSSPGPGRDQ